MTTPSGTSLNVGKFKVDCAIDDDGHLTIIVASNDGSALIETEDEVGCNEKEFGARFTTEKIEADFLAA